MRASEMYDNLSHAWFKWQALAQQVEAVREQREGETAELALAQDEHEAGLRRELQQCQAELARTHDAMVEQLQAVQVRLTNHA